MSEHAFDPMPDEEQETATVIAADAATTTALDAVTDDAPAPTAIVTLDQIVAAITSGRWAHETPGTELWLNTSFPPKDREIDAFVQELQAYGVAVE